MTILHFGELLDTVAGILDDAAIPCENATETWCAKGEAKWRAHIQCPHCSRNDWMLWCEPCRDFIIATPDAFECGACGEVVAPARRLVSEFLPLEK